MANLFNTHLNLTQIKDKNNFNQNQNEFIVKILEGTNQWASLDILASTIDTQQLNNLRAAIKDEISNTSYFTFKNLITNYQYVRTLKKVLGDVQGALDQKSHLETLSTKEAEKYNKLAKKMDNLYKQTEQTYHGTIMLPVNQALEPRIGNSQGECFGYIAKWAVQILKNERPFGLNLNAKPIFKPVPFSSLTARKHPDINHLAVLTKDISVYQKLQSTVEELIEELSGISGSSDDKSSNEVIDYKKNSNFSFYKSTTEVAQTLVNEAQKSPDKVYNLNILTYTGGHAMGFCLIDNKYHFFDSNSGWFRFDKDQDFINWFPYYYKQRGYEAYNFNEYAISHYSLSKNSLKPSKNKEPMSLASKIILGAVVALLSPIIAVYLVGVLTNMFVIRGFRYLGIIVSKFFSSEDNQPDLEELDPANDNLEREPLPNSLEPLDLAGCVHKEEKRSQVESRLGYLDLAVKSPMKRSGSPAFFSEATLVQAKDDTTDSSHQLAKIR